MDAPEGWTFEDGDKALVRGLKFRDFSEAFAFLTRVALHAEADVLMVADIDRGGAFAALLGTWEWLTPEERALVRGFILNKFRGDPALLEPGPALLQQRTGVPVVGVVPYL